MPPDGWGVLLGPASDLAGQVWTAAMLALWNAGLWLLRVVLQLEDGLLTPDLTDAGPAAAAYRVTFWLAGALAVVLLLVQLGLVLLRRDARSLGAALWGCGKFVVVCAAWLGYGTAVVAACGGLTRALLRELLHVNAWGEWRPGLVLRPETAVDATVATVLGLLGLVLWLAALGHLVVMISRAATLLVLAATTPIAAAGLVGEAGRAWFWKSLRWFHAAALTPVLMALLVGVGVQATTGVASGLAEGPARAVGTALPGVLLISVSCFAPTALFRLLAFVDPATPAGAQVRQVIDTLAQTQALFTQPVAAVRNVLRGADDGSDGRAGDDDPAVSRRAAAQGQLDEATPSGPPLDGGRPANLPPHSGPGLPQQDPPAPADSAPPPAVASDAGRPLPSRPGPGFFPSPAESGPSGPPGIAGGAAGEAAAVPVVPV